MKTVVVDVVSDVICPWCYLGKYRLDQAIASISDVEVVIHWRPFFLDPSIPPAGMDRHKYMVAKFGEERLKTLHDPLIKIGKEEGVPYHFDKITRTPNTLNAHRLIRWAALADKQQQLVSALFDAYWRDGRDIGDTGTLVDIAAASGLDGKQIAKDLQSDLDKLEVASEVKQAQQMGVSGVPTFILAQKYGVSGAQSASLLADAIHRAAESTKP